VQAIAASIAIATAATTLAGLSMNSILFLLAVEIAVSIAFVLSLSRALEKCSPPFRTMGTGSLWLLVIPLVNRFYIFAVASNMAKSLGNEFRARGIQNVEDSPGQTAGMIMGIGGLGAIVVGMAAPNLANFANLGYAVLFGLYWGKINRFSRLLDTVPAPMAGYPAPGYPAAGPPVWPQGNAQNAPPQGYAPGAAPQSPPPGNWPQR
jgi:hypothetical protein